MQPSVDVLLSVSRLTALHNPWHRCALLCNAVEAMLSYMEESNAYLETVTPETVLSALDDVRTEGMTASFNANNLTKEVIANCSVRFSPSGECKERVNAFLEELIAVNESAAKAVSDDFFYNA